ncbi:MAG: chorismate lyase [Sulfuritalea sp.]|jgi:chorismate--pyruvate lyase|nr:chorismate lyase [Sulfuritalea sp.]
MRKALGDRKTRGRDAGGWLALGGVLSGVPAAEPGVARDWLRATGSLTARLQQSGPTTVQLLRQGLYQPQRDERRVLRLAPGRLAPVREVVLRVQGRVAVYAHTVVNRAALKLLRRAGRRPLATVLFADPQVKAGPLYYRQLDARHPLHRAAALWCEGAVPHRLAARRALFTRGAARLLVTEVFLPWSQDDA